MKIFSDKEFSRVSIQAALSVYSHFTKTKQSSLILASGASPQPMYQELIRLNKSMNLFENTNFYHLDEFLNVDKSQTFGQELQKDFFQPLKINIKKLTQWDTGDADDWRTIAEKIDKEIFENPPEVCILGIGTNGHIGFNEPGTPMTSTSRKMKLSPETKKALGPRFNGKNNVPSHAIGLGISSILRAKKIILVASGSDKAEAISKMLTGPISPDCPASFLRLHPDVEIYGDEAALKLHQTRPEAYVEDHLVLRTGKKFEGDVLFMSPHPDDTSISAGAVLSRHSQSQKICAVNFYSGHRSEIPGTTRQERVDIRKKEAKEEAEILNISSEFLELSGYDGEDPLNSDDLTRIREVIERFKPKNIFIPMFDDSHEAHRNCAHATMKALEGLKCSDPLYIWQYETPWRLFRPGEMNVFVALDQDEISTKLRAIGAHRSQVERVPFDYGADALARLRAVISQEQELNVFGSTTRMCLGKHVECFFRFQVI